MAVATQIKTKDKIIEETIKIILDPEDGPEIRKHVREYLENLYFAKRFKATAIDEETEIFVRGLCYADGYLECAAKHSLVV